MGLKDLLNAGICIAGSAYDHRVKPLGEMSETAQRRQGYTDKDGFWTERGHDRATTRDHDLMAKSTKAISKEKK